MGVLLRLRCALLWARNGVLLASVRNRGRERDRGHMRLTSFRCEQAFPDKKYCHGEHLFGTITVPTFISSDLLYIT